MENKFMQILLQFDDIIKIHSGEMEHMILQRNYQELCEELSRYNYYRQYKKVLNKYLKIKKRVKFLVGILYLIIFVAVILIILL